jgi:hypothetical protein
MTLTALFGATGAVDVIAGQGDVMLKRAPDGRGSADQ